jgi:hypothetical protein
MASRPDKAKIIDEVWDEDRLRTFLDRAPADPQVDADFHALWQAYQGMRIGDFRRFLRLFVAAGRSLDGRNERGETLATFISTHRHAAPFIEALCQAGAAQPATDQEL